MLSTETSKKEFANDVVTAWKESAEEKLEREQPDTLGLEKDIYSYTFHVFCTSHNAVKVSELMMMCFATFTIQLTIVLNKYLETVKDESEPFIGDALLNMARLIASYIMHLYLYPEIKISMQMIHYAVYNRQKMMQKCTFFPLFIATAKFLGAFITEIATIYFMVRNKKVNSVIGSFVSFSLVSKIDNIMAKTLTGVNIGTEMGAKPIKFNANSKFSDDLIIIKEWFGSGDMNIIQWVFMTIFLAISRVFKFCYICVYFYFTPILVMLLVEYSSYTQSLYTADV